MTAPKIKTLFDFAKQYLAHGHEVILMHRPTESGCSCGAASCTKVGKHPRFANWPNRTIRDEHSLRCALNAYPNSNIAIVPTSTVVVIDVDAKYGGLASLDNLQRKYGKLPRCPTVLTGGGGQHLYFSSEASVGNSISKLAPGIDIKTKGSCVTVPPSLHASGRAYQWAAGRGLELDMPPLPDWIYERLTSAKANSLAYEPLAPREGFLEGERNVQMTRLTGHLLGKNIQPSVAAPLLIAFDGQFNRPPLGEAEVMAIFRSIAGRELAKRRRRGND